MSGESGLREFMSIEFLRGAGKGLLCVAENDSSMSSRLSSSTGWLFCLRELTDFFGILVFY